MGKPAARLTDPTAHGGTIVGPGVPTVLIGKMPAATLGDNHVCPMMTPGTPPIPHVGGPITLGSTGVFIGKKPAARMGDMAVCVGPPSSIIMGCPTVLIGEAGSGSQAGSAGAAAAAAAASLSSPKGIKAIEIPKKEAKTQEAHHIELAFVDSAGKHLQAVPFLLKDPDNAKILGASNPEGNYHKGGYTKAGKFEVALQSLSDATWTGAANDGEELELQCKAPNCPDGQSGIFQIDVLTESGQLFNLASIPTKVSGESLKAKWKFHEVDLEPIRKQSGSEAKSMQFLAQAGSMAIISPPLELGASKGKYGSAARAKLKGQWFDEDSDRILPERASELRKVARYLAGRRGLKGHIVLGNAGPKGEATPTAALNTKRGQILASLLLNQSDVFLHRFEKGGWGNKEAQGFLNGLHDESGSPWFTGPISDDWDEQGAHQLGQFQKENGLLDHVGVDARFGAKVFELIHVAAGEPRAAALVTLVSDTTPKLAEDVTLELFFWLRGKGPKVADYKNSSQAVYDDMDKGVVLELGGEIGGWSA